MTNRMVLRAISVGLDEQWPLGEVVLVEPKAGKLDVYYLEQESSETGSDD